LPEIVNVTRSICVPGTGAESVWIDAFLNHVTGAQLFYTVNHGPPEMKTMSFVTGNEYTARILNLSLGDRVEYWVRAVNANPDTALSERGGYFIGTVPVAEVRETDAAGNALHAGFGARVQASVTCGYGELGTSTTDFFVQDATGGLRVYKATPNSVRPNRGDVVRVTGTVAQVDGEIRITSGSICGLFVQVLNTGTPPAPTPVALCDLGEEHEGMLVEVDGAVFSSLSAGETLMGDTDYALTLCEPVLAVDAETDLAGLVLPSPIFDVVALVGQRDTEGEPDAGFRLIPRGAADLAFVTSGTGAAPAIFSHSVLLQNHPNPVRSATEIRFLVAPAPGEETASVTLSLFDLRGRRLGVLLDGRLPAGEKAVRLSVLDLPAGATGLLFYRLQVNGEVHTRKLLVLP
jgi:hypothetical protein